MNSGNLNLWNQPRPDVGVEALLDEVRMRVENGLGSEETLGTVIKCLAATRERGAAWLRVLANDQHSIMKYQLIDVLLELASYVEPAMRLRKEIVDQAFDWMRYGERFDYSTLRTEGLLYYWLRRADSTVVEMEYSRFSSGEDEQPYTDAELDAFYNENTQLVHQTMLREVSPDHGVFYKNPLKNFNAKRYYKYYEKLLNVAHGERELNEPDPALSL